MTFCRISAEKKTSVKRSNVILGILLFFLLFLTLRNATLAAIGVRRGLFLCAHTVIPSLFPFMILSDLVISGGFGNRGIDLLTRPLQHLFRLPAAGCAAFLFGILCGFPIGAKCAASAYDRGLLQKRECEDVIAASGIPSPAFLIGAVGNSLWRDPQFGLLLWLASLLVAILTATVLGRLRAPAAPCTASDVMEKSSQNPSGLFTSSVRSATAGMLSVCAYVLFFSALTGTLRPVTAHLPNAKLWDALFSAFSELSGGMEALSGLPDRGLGCVLSATAVGWSGLAVHCQIFAVCDGRGLSFRTYLPIKLLQGIGLALLFSVLLPSLQI